MNLYKLSPEAGVFKFFVSITSLWKEYQFTKKCVHEGILYSALDWYSVPFYSNYILNLPDKNYVQEYGDQGFWKVIKYIGI